MSPGFFDDLSRALATPMPRRQALRLAAGALAAVALPGVGARTARAGLARGTGGCPPGSKLSCADQFGPTISECCSRPIPGSGNYTCCPPGECFYSPTTNNCCPKAFQCGRGGCCNEGERCVNEKCVRCDSDKICGKECCEESETCANPAKGLCCVKTWHQCKVAGAAGSSGPVVKCCPPREECCTNRATKKVTCCDAKHPCVDGRCKCGKDETPCGDGKCCDKDKEVCSNGKCCPKGKTNCGDGRCCGDKDDCCEKMCCDGPGRVCAGGKCCPAGRVIGSGKSALCCPPGTVGVGPPTKRQCCPRNDRKCCDDEDAGLTVLCSKDKTCVRGKCEKL